MKSERKVRSLEFYSGIGGMHYGLKVAYQNSEVLSSFDINTTANTIYRHNFPAVKMSQNNIEAIPVDVLDKYDADLWTMSPPCQPFTRKGLQKGALDRRCDSLKSLMEKIEKMKKPPRMIFLENVVGFETSSIHDDVIRILQSMNYNLEEFILSPPQFGIPNTRPRYYLLALLKHRLDHPIPYSPVIQRTHKKCVSEEHIKKIGSYLCTVSPESLQVDDITLSKYGEAIDVISPLSNRSACFTKSYGNYIAGCGSYVVEDENTISSNRLLPLTSLQSLPFVRRLSPREVSNLMCFPSEFSWPNETTTKQLYRTLGNSVNVCVVSILLEQLIREYLVNCENRNNE